MSLAVDIPTAGPAADGSIDLGEDTARRGVVAGLVSLARPRQWTKNALVLVAPGAAGILGHVHPLLITLGAVGVFCVASSGTYAINDALDAEADRKHPTKCNRPVAANVVSRNGAITFGLACLVGAIGLAFALAGFRFVIVIAAYIGLTCAYSLRLKRMPVIEMASVSAGFVLRAIAGGVATGVVLSNWFVIVASFGSLFIVAGKRSAEHSGLGDERSAHRHALAFYPLTFLRSIRLLAASVTVTAYCLWAFARSTHLGPGQHSIWFELSIVPIVLAVMLVELQFENGGGSSPEEMALSDRSLQLAALTWAALFAVGVYT
jgi:decaprenyl-phosphate phosphoribosyltransferase